MTQRLLRDLLSVGGRGAGIEEQVHGCACAIVADAHMRNMRAEEMLVGLKLEWAALVDEQGSLRLDRTRALGNRLVSHSIRLFYAGASNESGLDDAGSAPEIATLPRGGATPAS